MFLYFVVVFRCCAVCCVLPCCAAFVFRFVLCCVLCFVPCWDSWSVNLNLGRKPPSSCKKNRWLEKLGGKRFGGVKHSSVAKRSGECQRSDTSPNRFTTHEHQDRQQGSGVHGSLQGPRVSSRSKGLFFQGLRVSFSGSEGLFYQGSEGLFYQGSEGFFFLKGLRVFFLKGLWVFFLKGLTVFFQGLRVFFSWSECFFDVFLIFRSLTVFECFCVCF